ncbi:uncharacterized protein LOC130883117 isoform X2 [Chionomys nivalis]|uniref:uncharacterized protein LOC130883117 isoform X2 n=1 Tax=Chionomys nivalis TaxID=269649 RepID=UPI002597C122|nr:uncharacterized protein LOC130883117 isoform X2 [Chionomys nivalis]
MMQKSLRQGWADPSAVFVERCAGGCSPTRELVSLISSVLPQPLHRSLLAPARLLEACLHSLLSFLTSNFPSNPLLPDPLFSIERLSRRPVASSCAISCYAQVLRAAHLHRRAAGIAHQPCWLKSKGRRTPGRTVQGPHDDAQREDPTSPSARTPGRPAQGPQDTQREDRGHPARGPRTPSARTPRCPARGSHGTQQKDLLDQAKVITQNPAWDPGHTDTDTCPQDPPTVNLSLTSLFGDPLNGYDIMVYPSDHCWCTIISLFMSQLTSRLTTSHDQLFQPFQVLLDI